jgi:hypothetical protein
MSKLRRPPVTSEEDFIAGAEERQARIVSQNKDSDKKAVAKIRFTVSIEKELVEKVRNAAYWLPGYTIGKIVSEGLEKELKKLEEEHGPFQQRKGEVPRGRPLVP